MKQPTLTALLGASFGLALCQFCISLEAVLNYASANVGTETLLKYGKVYGTLIVLIGLIVRSLCTPPPAGVALTAAACTAAAFVMRHSRADGPRRLAFVAAAVCEAALAAYALARCAQRLAWLVRHGGSAPGIVEEVAYAVATVSVLAALAAVLAAVAAKLNARRVDAGDEEVDDTWGLGTKGAGPEAADYWLGAVAGISFAVCMRSLAVFVEFASRFPPKPTWPLLYAAKLTLGIVQLTTSPVALYGGLTANTNCIVAGMAAAILQVLLYAALVVLNIIDYSLPVHMLHWAAVSGAESMATVAVLATAYVRVSSPPTLSYKLLQSVAGDA